MGFAGDIKAFEQKALLAANNSVCKAAEVGFTEAVINSPTSPEASYATGLLINSWFPAIASFDETVGNATDYYGTASLSRIRTILAQKPFYGKDSFVTLTNSVDHAYRANYLGWPAGLGTNGWHWTGNVQAYHFVSTAINNIRGKYI